MKFNVQTAVIKPLNDYLSKINLFQYNARLYLVNVIVSGISLGVFRLLFNFYILSLGFNEVLIGQLITTSSLTALIVALPMGYLADVIGRKRSLLIGGLLTGLSIIGMVLWPTVFVFYILNVVMGFSQSL
ncbi:MAG: MFS transporter, partial [Anaerolineales bacterium]|nr:MFS transporter [Anaerolineales bacterium]